MNKWILAPTLVDFNAQTATSLSWLSPPVTYRVENTAFGTDRCPANS